MLQTRVSDKQNDSRAYEFSANGELDLNSGGHQLRLLFQSDGSATLQLDGNALTPLSATQVHSALWSNPC